MKSNILISLLISCIFYSCQKSESVLRQHGTLIYAAICKDGIVIASDSRIAQVNPSTGRILSYANGFQKIFRYNNIVFTMAGNVGFKDFMFYGLFEKFKKEKIKGITLGTFHDQFLAFAKKNLLPFEYDMLVQNCFLVCGYQGKTPYIYKYQPANGDNRIFNSPILTCSVPGFDTNFQLTKRFGSLNFIQAKKTIDSILTAEVAIRHAHHAIHFGGEHYFATMTYQKIDFNQSVYKHEFATTKELYQAFKQRKIKSYYPTPQDSVIFSALLNNLKL